MITSRNHLLSSRNLYFEQLPAIVGSEDKEVIQILSPQRTQELGTINLNISIQQILHRGKKSLFGNFWRIYV